MIQAEYGESFETIEIQRNFKFFIGIQIPKERQVYECVFEKRQSHPIKYYKIVKQVFGHVLNFYLHCMNVFAKSNVSVIVKHIRSICNLRKRSFFMR